MISLLTPCQNWTLSDKPPTSALIRTPEQRLQLLTSLIEHYGKSKTPQMIASVGTMKEIRDELLDIEEGNAKPQDDAKNRCLDKIFESLALVEYHRRKMEDHRRKMEMVSEESNVRTHVLLSLCQLGVQNDANLALVASDQGTQTRVRTVVVGE